MISSKLASIGLGASLVAILPAVSAQAQVNRTFVSAAGSDSNNCANVNTPCRHFAAAYAATAPHGEIFVLDPANYGSLTVTHAVSIQGHGWASIAPPNNGNAITINAGPGDSISIHGVAIDGTGATGGTSGIVFNSGGSLTVADCVVQNFVDNGNIGTGVGIYIAPAVGPVAFTITNTTLANNTQPGILFYPQGGSFNTNGVIDHVVADANGYGIDILPILSTGGTAAIAVSNSIASNNSTGILINNTGSACTLKVSLDNVSASGNSVNGITGQATANILLGRSVITGNAGSGVFNATFAPNTFYTYQNNQIDLNGTDVNGPALNTTKPVR